MQFCFSCLSDPVMLSALQFEGAWRLQSRVQKEFGCMKPIQNKTVPWMPGQSYCLNYMGFLSESYIQVKAQSLSFRAGSTDMTVMFYSQLLNTWFTTSENCTNISFFFFFFSIRKLLIESYWPRHPVFKWIIHPPDLSSFCGT